jgi:hypothetical protein
MTRQEQIDRLEDEFGIECYYAAEGRYEPDYEYLAERFNKVFALIEVRDGRSNDIVIMGASHVE